jgi:uncharacterized protein
MNLKALIKRHSVAIYFSLAFIISWGSGLVVLVPKLIRGEVIHSLDALLLFPVLVLGVALTGLTLIGITDGRSGVKDLFSRIGRWRVSAPWYAAAILIPPILITVVLLAFRILITPIFSPNLFPMGILYGLFPGFFEEIGWMGFVFPGMHRVHSLLTAGVILGVLWGLWRLPVVDSLGAAAPHGAYWLPFFLSFAALVASVDRHLLAAEVGKRIGRACRRPNAWQSSHQSQNKNQRDEPFESEVHHFLHPPFPQIQRDEKNQRMRLAVSEQSLSLTRSRVLSIMAAAALAVMQGRLGNDQSHFDCVAQPNQSIAQLGGAIKRLDFVQ